MFYYKIKNCFHMFRLDNLIDFEFCIESEHLNLEIILLFKKSYHWAINICQVYNKLLAIRHILFMTGTKLTPGLLIVNNKILLNKIGFKVDDCNCFYGIKAQKSNYNNNNYISQ